MTESIATANSAISELPEKPAEQLKPMILIYILNLTFKILWQVGTCSTTANLLDLLDFVEMAFYLHSEGMTQRTACSYFHNHKQKYSNCQQFAFKCLKNYTYIHTHPSSSTPNNTYIFFINGPPKVHTDISSNAQNTYIPFFKCPKNTYRPLLKCPQNTCLPGDLLGVLSKPQKVYKSREPYKDFREGEREISTGFLGFPEILTLNVKRFVRSVDLEDQDEKGTLQVVVVVQSGSFRLQEEGLQLQCLVAQSLMKKVQQQQQLPPAQQLRLSPLHPQAAIMSKSETKQFCENTG